MYWDEMHIVPVSVSTTVSSPTEDSKEETNGFVSVSRPISFPMTNSETKAPDFSVETDVDLSDPNLQKELILFINSHCKTQSSNITKISSHFLEACVTLNAYRVILRNSKRELIGVILSIPLPIEMPFEMPSNLPPPTINDGVVNELLQNNPKVVASGCTTYMCISPSERHQGLCMALIRGIIEVGFSRNILTGYHTVLKQITGRGLKIESWFFPLHIKNARNKGFQFPNPTLKTDRTNFRETLKWSTRLPPGLNVERVTPDYLLAESLEIYTKFSQGKRFRFCPNLITWRKWILSFPSYVVKRINGTSCESLGFFSCHNFEIVVPSNNQVASIIVPILMAGSQPETLKASIFEAAKTKAEVISFHQCGDLTSQHLLSVNALLTKSETWFDMYNSDLQLTPEEICTPIL